MADFRFIPNDPALLNDPEVVAWLERCANAVEVEMLLMPEAEFNGLMDEAARKIVTGEGLSIQAARELWGEPEGESYGRS
jgi:hypothetical protein